MKHHAKASSAGSTDGSGSSRAALRSASVTRGASGSSKGSGAPSARLIATLALAIAGLLALSAAPALAAGPTVTIDPVTVHGITTAQFSGDITVDSEANGGVATTWCFEITPAGAEQWGVTNCGDQAVPVGTSEEVKGQATGLSPGQSYEARILYNSTELLTSAPSPSFTTDPAPNTPTLTLGPATNVAYTTVHLAGTIDPEGGNVDPVAGAIPIGWELQVNREGNGWEGLAGGTVEAPAAAESDPVAVQGDITGLQPGAEYEYRLRAVYAGTEVLTSVGEFNTDPVAKPTLTLDPVTTHTDSTATFTGEVETNAPASPMPAAEAAFETTWHVSCNPGCPNLSPDAGAGTVTAVEGSKTFSLDATELEPDTTYEVTLEATNAGGTSTAIQSFATTTIPATITAAPGAPDGKGGYTLEGVVNPHNSIVDCKFLWSTEAGLTPADYPNSAPCTPTPGEVNKPVTVEAHLTGLIVGATYHSRLVVSNGAGSEETDDQAFTPTQDATQTCPNEQQRTENNSLALPECRAYEQVTDPIKEGADTRAFAFSDDGLSVGYHSSASNIANSGQGVAGFGLNAYVATRTSAGWKTIPNLNGPSGSLYTKPDGLVGTGENFPRFYSPDLRSSIWFTKPGAKTQYEVRAFLRDSTGDFKQISDSKFGGLGNYTNVITGASPDLSHIVFSTPAAIYESVGLHDEQLTRLDVDNSGDPIGSCSMGDYQDSVVLGNSVSTDASVTVFTVTGGCGGENPLANEIWARVDGTTSYDASASQCTRLAPDPCNAPADAKFIGASRDGSSVFFATTQQLVNGDTDETNDLYVYDLPTASSPSPHLTEISGANAAADVEIHETTYSTRRDNEYLLEGAISTDGSTVLFTAQGVLAANEDALGETAVAGHHNLYVWRRDAGHPEGQTKFLGRLIDDDLNSAQHYAQTTADGHYFVFATATPLVSTDTDSARDVYLCNSVTGTMIRVSMNTLGGGGNNDLFDAGITFGAPNNDPGPLAHPAVSNDGEAVVFTTAEPLSPLDHNDASDVYLWKAGRVSLVTIGTLGGGIAEVPGDNYPVGISGSGADIFFPSRQQLSPTDGDGGADIYDARIGGGFSVPRRESCSGEACQSPPSGSPSISASVTENPTTEGNLNPKRCPRGKVFKRNKCVKKPREKRHHKNREGHAKRAGSKSGDAK